MLSQVCLYLNNWFDWNQSHYYGKFTISDGALSIADEIKENQYYRIIGSVFNDGVYKHGDEELVDEMFEGAIWLMAVPQDVIDLAAEIAAWQDKYGSVGSEGMSPFQSESFGGYSYTKASGSSSGASGSSVPTWQGVFADRLRRYKKL